MDNKKMRRRSVLTADFSCQENVLSLENDEEIEKIKQQYEQKFNQDKFILDDLEKQIFDLHEKRKNIMRINLSNNQKNLIIDKLREEVTKSKNEQKNFLDKCKKYHRHLQTENTMLAQSSFITSMRSARAVFSESCSYKCQKCGRYVLNRILESEKELMTEWDKNAQEDLESEVISNRCNNMFQTNINMFNHVFEKIESLHKDFVKNVTLMKTSINLQTTDHYDAAQQAYHLRLKRNELNDANQKLSRLREGLIDIKQAEQFDIADEQKITSSLNKLRKIVNQLEQETECAEDLQELKHLRELLNDESVTNKTVSEKFRFYKDKISQINYNWQNNERIWRKAIDSSALGAIKKRKQSIADLKNELSLMCNMEETHKEHRREMVRNMKDENAKVREVRKALLHGIGKLIASEKHIECQLAGFTTEASIKKSELCSIEQRMVDVQPILIKYNIFKSMYPFWKKHIANEKVRLCVLIETYENRMLDLKKNEREQVRVMTEAVTALSKLGRMEKQCWDPVKINQQNAIINFFAAVDDFFKKFADIEVFVYNIDDIKNMKMQHEKMQSMLDNELLSACLECGTYAKLKTISSDENVLAQSNFKNAGSSKSEDSQIPDVVHQK